MERLPFTPLSTENNPSSRDHGMKLAEAIIRSTDLAVITTDLKGTITSFNTAAENMTGFHASEVVGISSLMVLFYKSDIEKKFPSAKDEGEIFELLTAKVRQTARSQREEWIFAHRTGRTFPVAVSVSPLRIGDGITGFTMWSNDVSDQLNYQKQIEESETQLKSLVSSIDDIVFELDLEGRFNYIWVKSDDFLFLPREKIYGRTVEDMLGHEFARPFQAAFNSVVQTGTPTSYEYKSPLPGDERWFAAKFATIFDRGVKTDRISVCIQNITDRKKMELSIRESEEKFRLLAHNIPGAVYLMKNDPEHTIAYINAGIWNLTGYAASEFLSAQRKLYALIHEDDRTYVSNIRSRAVEERTGYQLEYRLLHQSGDYRWVSDTGVGLYTGDQLDYFEGCITDITPRKQSEEELRRMADENSRIFNNSLTLGALVSFDGYFRKLNPAWEKTLGWTREELTSRPFKSFIHPDDQAKTQEMFDVLTGGETIHTFENRYRCKDGSFRWLLWSSSPDIARRLIYASAIDITSRKKSEDELLLSKRNLEAAAYELEEQNRQLDEFAHIISHNLRAPVNNIRALLNFINDTSTISDYQLIFEKIKNVTFNISETMNELLETIRIRKNTEIERVEIRFKDILDKVIQSLEGELIESGATITYNFNNAPKIYYSKPYLESILQNLLSNAIKYRSQSRIPEIFVSTDIIQSGIEMRVQDNGLGIDLQQYGHKLFGLHKTFHENKEARGVGLFLTKTQIETLGGTISAESEVEKGTTFIIQF